MEKELRAKVIQLDPSGCGQAHADDGKTYQIPYTLPGEEVTFHVKRTRRKTFINDVEITKKSTERVTPLCEHFGTCGGCSLQHLTHQTYVEYKSAKVLHALQEADITCQLVAPLVEIRPTQRWRANFEGIKTPSEFRLGFHKRQSHHIVNLNECHTLHPTLFSVIKAFQEVLATVLEDYQKVQIFTQLCDNGVDIWFDIQGQKELAQIHTERLKRFAQKHDVAKLTFRHRKTRNFIYDNGQPHVDISGFDVPIRATDFLQSGPQSQEALTQLVLEPLKKCGPLKVADLFSGLGTFSLPLAKLARVDAFEFDNHACSVLASVANHYELPIKTYVRNLFDTPLTAQELALYDAVVIDPPRAGANNQCHELSQSNVAHIIYVSCQIESLMKDAKLLTAAGYSFEHLTPVDQFPYTPHLECVAYFRKK